MSDILIKGIEMPKNCKECFACKAELSPEKKVIYVCCFARTSCPLIPVPPHGDLIDKEALMKDFDSPYRFRTFGDVPVFHEEAIRTAPTIIPASEEGE